MAPSILAIAGPHVIHEVFDDEVVIINLESGRYYTMSETGAAIWQLVTQRASVAAIRSAIFRRYDGPSPDLTAAVDRFLDELRREGLVAPAEQALPAAAPVALPAAEPDTARLPFQPPTLSKYTDMEDLLLLDPIHEVDESGWPNRKLPPAR